MAKATKLQLPNLSSGDKFALLTCCLQLCLCHSRYENGVTVFFFIESLEKGLKLQLKLDGCLLIQALRSDYVRKTD